MGDKVIHPDHYGWIPGIECMAVVRHFDFLLGNVIKYCWRSGRKGSETQLDDLKKAAYYLQEKIKMVEAEQVDTVSTSCGCSGCLDKAGSTSDEICRCGHFPSAHPRTSENALTKRFRCTVLSCDCEDYHEQESE